METSNKIEYRPNSQKITQLLFAGAVATVVFLIAEAIMSALFGYFGFTETIRSAITQDVLRPETINGAWWAALFVVALLNVIVLPFAYDLLNTKGAIGAKRLSRGVAWGFIFGLVVQAVVAPVAGYGFFKSELPSPLFQVVTSMIAWAIYGATFEKLTRVRFVHEMNLERKRAA